MMKKVLAVYMLAVFLGIALAACTPGSKAEKDAAVAAVKRYNSTLRRAYLEVNIELMKSVATENQLSKLFPVMAALAASKNTMIAHQDSFRVGKVWVKGDTAYVETREQWEYWWQSMETGAITRETKAVSYDIRYTVMKENGIWKVDKIEKVE